MGETQPVVTGMEAVISALTNSSIYCYDCSSFSWYLLLTQVD